MDQNLQQIFKSFNTKTSLKFVKEDNDTQFISVNIGISSNTELSNDILKKIEELLNSLLLDEYITNEEYENNKIDKKELLKESKAKAKSVEMEAKMLDKKAKMDIKAMKLEYLDMRKRFDKTNIKPNKIKH